MLSCRVLPALAVFPTAFLVTMQAVVLLARQLILLAQSIRHVLNLLCAIKPPAKAAVKPATILLVLYVKLALWPRMEGVYPALWVA